MAIELVVFDMAGTTVSDNEAVARSFQGALRDAGLEVARSDINAVMGLHKPEAIRRLIDAAPQAVRTTKSVAQIHADFVVRMIHFYRTDVGVCEISGATQVFKRLRKHDIKIALNSGFSRDIADIIITRLGWTIPGLIDASVTSDEVARGRPYPDMIQHLMSQLGVQSAENVVKVGDTPADLEEGARAGCGRIIGVTRGSHTREELARYPHTDLINTVADLPGLLGL